MPDGEDGFVPPWDCAAHLVAEAAEPWGHWDDPTVPPPPPDDEEEKEEEKEKGGAKGGKAAKGKAAAKDKSKEKAKEEEEKKKKGKSGRAALGDGPPSPASRPPVFVGTKVSARVPLGEKDEAKRTRHLAEPLLWFAHKRTVGAKMKGKQMGSIRQHNRQ